MAPSALVRDMAALTGAAILFVIRKRLTRGESNDNV